MIVDLYHSGSSVKDLSSEYGVSNVTIYKWIKDLTPVEGTDGKEITLKDIDAIQKENLRWKRVQRLMKKAGIRYITLKNSIQHLVKKRWKNEKTLLKETFLRLRLTKNGLAI